MWHNATPPCNASQDSASDGLPFHFVLLAVLLALMNLWAVLGNLVVGLALLRFESLRRISNYLIGNLALSDFLLSVTVLPFSMTSDLLGHWVFGEVMCKIWLAIDVLYCTASIWNICAIAFDRFTATTFPLWYRERRSGLTALVYIAVVWTWSFVISVPPIVLSQSSFNETYTKIHDTDTYVCKLYDQQWYVIYSATGSFILPIGILTILYAKIFVVLHKQSQTKQRKRLNAAATVSMLSAQTAQGSSEVSSPVNRLTQCVSTPQTTDFDRVESTDSLPSEGRRKCDLGESEEQENDEWRDKVSADLVFTTSQRSRLGNQRASRSGGSLTESIFIRHLSGRLSTSPASSMFRQIILRQHQRHVSISEQPPARTRTMSYDSAAEAFQFAESVRSKHGSGRGSLMLLQPRTSIFTRRSTTTASTRRRQSLKRFTKREAEATRKCLYIIIAFLIAWMPFLVTYLLRGMANLAIHPYVMTAIIWCGYASSAINPCLYALYNEEFRQAFRKILTHAAICNKDVI